MLHTNSQTPSQQVCTTSIALLYFYHAHQRQKHTFEPLEYIVVFLYKKAESFYSQLFAIQFQGCQSQKQDYQKTPRQILQAL